MRECFFAPFSTARRTWRERVWIYLATLLLLTIPHKLCALDRDRTIAQFLHTAWQAADGAPSGVHGLAQTTDGYLWLASSSGLFRFDGVRFERYEPREGGTLQFRDISAILATPDGGLWVGRAGRIIYLKNGHAFTYGRAEGLSVTTVFRFALDRQGSVWAATSRGLERFENSQWTEVGPEWNFTAKTATDIFADSHGDLWVSAPGSLFCLPPDTHSFRMRKTTKPLLIREGPGGALWLSEYGDGIHAIEPQLAELSDSKSRLLPGGGLREVLVDRDGSMWLTDTGIARIAYPDSRSAVGIDSTQTAVQHFGHKDGLTSDTVLAMLEDREGNIWVGTTAGLDRFRRRNVVPSAFPFGSDETLALSTDKQGSVLAAGAEWLMRFQNGVVSTQARLRMPIGYEFPHSSVRSTYRDADGTLWLGGHGVLVRVNGSRVENIELPNEVLADGPWDIQAITRDPAGDLWVSIQQHGVFKRHDGAWGRIQDFGELPPGRTPASLWTDARGRIWWRYVGTRIARLDGSKVKVYSSEELHIGEVTFIGGRGDHIWVAGQFGFGLFDGNRFHTVAGQADAAFRGITGIIETDDGDFWLNQATGIAHIPAAEIRSRMQNVHHTLQYGLFDFRDGVPGAGATTSGPLPSAVLGSDGLIWMTGPNGVYWIDPARIYRNPLPPPVSIEGIYADDKSFDPSTASRLPALASNLRIEYTALSLSIPERVRFRYQLEGYDKNWQDVGTRRAAYYSKLPPGHFRFHVIAANNDGVWNPTGAVAELDIPPAFYQTAWFEASCAFAGLLLLWALYRYRLHQIAHEFNVRLDERLGERTRIARALHDTLLQSFQGLMLRFQVAHDELPGRPDEARKTLEYALDEAAQAITEGRNAVQGLRSSTVETNDLAQAIGSLGEELAGDKSNSSRVESFVEVEGTPRDIHPILRDEIYRIAGEALRNAFRHAHARRIKVAIGYGEEQFRLRVRDDGTGIDPEVLDQEGRTGHWGLAGMRERAELIGGELEIRSRRESGTQVELSLPASIAYTVLPARGFWWMVRKGGAKA